jgi:hypothetical protein
MHSSGASETSRRLGHRIAGKKMAGYGYCAAPESPPSSAQTQFRKPLGEADMSYYLSTAGASSSVTITFPKNAQGVQQYAKQFDFYWGSVDTWNSVTFTDILGNRTSFTGSDLCSNTTGSYGCFNIAGTDTPPTMDVNGAVVHFSTVADSAGIIYPWSSVTFTSSAPAFEFDNIRWYLAGCTSGPCTSAATLGSNASPVPEPSSMLLMGTGIFGFATLLKRKMGS